MPSKPVPVPVFADSSAPLVIGGEHIASWAMGQANIQEGATEQDIRTYEKKLALTLMNSQKHFRKDRTKRKR